MNPILSHSDPMQACKKCGKRKKLSEFYPCPRARNGRIGSCKGCVLAQGAVYRSENIERVRKHDRARGREPKRMKSAVRHATKWFESNPEARRAHKLVYLAIKRGALKECPCVVCGSKRSVAHHEDYDKPLDVVWLCQIHHKERHKELRRLALGMGNVAQDSRPPCRWAAQNLGAICRKRVRRRSRSARRRSRRGLPITRDRNSRGGTAASAGSAACGSPVALEGTGRRNCRWDEQPEKSGGTGR